MDFLQHNNKQKSKNEQLQAARASKKQNRKARNNRLNMFSKRMQEHKKIKLSKKLKENLMTASNVAKDIGFSMVTRSGKEKEHIESEKTKMHVCYSSSGVQMEGDPKLFQESILINLGCLNYTLQKIASHNQLCKGTVLLTGETTKALPSFLHGGMFSSLELRCSQCTHTIALETDFFNKNPRAPPSQDDPIVSRVSNMADMVGVAARNGSFVFSEYHFFFPTC